MSSNGNNNGNTTPPNEGRPRRGSITAQTFTSLFNRSNSTSGGPSGLPGPITTAAAQDQRRRMSISTLGLSGTSPSQQSPFPFPNRRSSVSTAGSESIDESAIDDEEGPSRSTNPPFAHRLSFGAQALRSVRTGGGSPGSSGSRGGNTQSQQASTQSMPRTPSDYTSSARPGDGVFNWSEQLRSRAESSVSQSQRPSLSTSPSNKHTFNIPTHERAKSVSEMPAPPTSAIPPAQPPKPVRRQPDPFQERILKGDFYMD
ncbi:hypothetical protein CJF32_00006018 [Rutstroemia sp. NJR-2017a WRK4]|nr:hypothetical protein CJF32_00006018 [Rutstroemia sp. NJR-2017a WRK4]